MNEFLMQPWVGNSMAVLSLLLSIIFFYKSRTRPALSCQVQGWRLIDKAKYKLPGDFRLLVREHDVPRLTLSQVFLWNSGSATLLGSQMVEDDPLRCTLSAGDRVLSVKVGARTRSSNKVAVDIGGSDATEVRISFDYLDPTDGARIDILHTSEERVPNIHATFRGIPSGVKRVAEPGARRISRILRTLVRHSTKVLIGAFTIGLLTMVTAVLPDPWFVPILPNTEPSWRFRVTQFGVGFLYALTSATPFLALRRRYPPALDSDRDIA